MANDIITLESIVGSVAETFERICVDKSLTFQCESEFALQVLYKSDYASKLALANPQSVRDAVTNIASIGLSLNPAKREAYLVPRKNGICLDFSYIGLTKLAVDSGSVRWAKAELVYQNDRLVLNGVDKPPTHERDPFSTQRGEVIGVYCVVKTIDGDYLTDTMSIVDVHAIRDRSEAWKAHVSKKIPCPWSTDPGEMIKKTVIKRASKMWPKTDRLDQAIHYLNTEGGQGINFSDQAAGQAGAQSPDPLSLRALWVGKAMLVQSIEEMTRVSKEGAKIFNSAKDREGYSAFATAVQTRAAVLRKQEVIDV